MEKPTKYDTDTDIVLPALTGRKGINPYQRKNARQVKRISHLDRFFGEHVVYKKNCFNPQKDIPEMYRRYNR